MFSSRPRAALLLLLMLLFCASPVEAARAAGRARATTPTTIYASVAGAGLFKSADVGSAWQGPANLPGDVQALAVGDAAHWRVVYAGLAGSLYVSHDGGTTWSKTALPTYNVSALALDPRDPTTVLAVTDHGLLVSADGGATWTAGSGITGTIYTLTAGITAGTYYAGGDGRAWTSSDGGRTWSAIGRLPARLAVYGITASPSISGTLYAATSRGLWQGVDGKWSQLRHGVPSRRFEAVTADAGHVAAIAAGDNGLYLSADGGATWTHRAVAGLSGGATVLARDAQNTATLVIGDANGAVEVSVDNGATWSASSGSVAGSVGNAVQALALVQRQPLPVDGTHTLRGAFLAFWQNTPNAQNVIGQPLTGEFSDSDRGGATAQYFERMELVQQGGKVVPAPLGADLAPSAYISATTPYTVDSRFLAFWTQYGGTDFFGAPVSPAFKQSIGDGTGQQYLVQYFRNARLEYHPEVAGVGSVVQVGRLGVLELQRKGWLPAGS